MDHEIDLILTLAGALTAALVFGLVAQKLRLSPIVGYLAAGIAVGPFTPGFVAHEGLARQLAELGVVLLMFGVGLNLHVRQLLAVKRVALPGALLGMLAACAAGAAVGGAFGWTFGAATFYGLAIAVTSTIVLLRVFGDEDLLQAPIGHLGLGWLLVEDLVVVLVVVLAPAIAGPSKASSGALAVAVALSIAKLAALVALVLALGRIAVPRFLVFVARTRSRELFTLAVLVLAVGVAALAAKVFGASVALGAFLAGLVVGQSEFASRAGSDALPMRDAFAVLFFVATGMLLDPRQIAANLPLTLATLAVVWTAKPLAALGVLVVSGRPLAHSLALAFGLGQIGEFTFVLSVVGRDLGVLPNAAVQSLLATSIVAIVANPFLVRLAGRLGRRFGGAAPAREAGEPARPAEFRAVLVGYGPIGKSLARLLREYGVEPTVVEMNHDALAPLREEKLGFVYGDASRPEILERAGVRTASSFVFTASGSSDAAVRAARALHPDIVILARAGYLRDAPALRAAGATEVVSAEGELALAMAERLLVRLGASAEQLDRARDRVRAEVGGFDGEVERPASE